MHVYKATLFWTYSAKNGKGAFHAYKLLILKLRNKSFLIYIGL